jgi:hypothetical protein
MSQTPYKVGSPTLVVYFYTRDTVYELHSKVGDPNTDVLSVSTSKDLNSATGTFSIEMVPQKDVNGKTWSDKIQVFDYVEIRMKGISDDKEHVVMRGLVDAIQRSESFGEIPRRTITISGRDLGVLLSDFSVWYCPMLDPVADSLRMLSWVKNPQMHYSIEQLFGEFLTKWKETMELTVGKPTYGEQTKSAVRPQANLVTPYSMGSSATLSDIPQYEAPPNTFPSAINLSNKIDSMARSIIPNMSSFISQMISYEGSFWNLFQTYQDKPFHEMFIWDADDNAKFVLRPARLKDGKGNLYKEVNQAI